MLDYHLHLWEHDQSDVSLRLDQIEAYCEHAQAHGVVEIALTEHLYRFVQATDVAQRFWETDEPSRVLRESMATYWDFHARSDLDAYAEMVLAAKAEGLPVVMGLEVDFYRDKMDKVAALLAGYPFDVLIGSVHWLGAWRFDDIDDPTSMEEWNVRQIDATWDAYCDAMDELADSGAVDVLAHPDLIKVTGAIPAQPMQWWDQIAEAAGRGGLAAEVSSAGWRKPVGEQYPALGLLTRFAAHDVPFTTASDAHGVGNVVDKAGEVRQLLDVAGVHHLRGFHGREPYVVTLTPPDPPATGER
jgi:histidinol-phosphatase (PHP family)